MRKNIIISTIAGTLVVTSAISLFSVLGGKKQLKESPYNDLSIVYTTDYDKQLTEEEMIFESTTTDVNREESVTSEEVTVSEQIEELQVDDYSYLERLNGIISEKNCTEEARKLILESFNLLYSNYNTTYGIYKGSGIPTREDFMEYLFTNFSKNIDTINVLDKNDEKNKSIVDSMGNTVGQYSRSDKTICILYENEFDCNNEICGLFLHECIHATQCDYLEGYKDDVLKFNNEGLWYIIVEGEANLITTATTDTIDCNGYKQYDNGDTNTCLNIKGKTIDYRYNMLYKLNSMIMHMIGYNELQSLKGETSPSKLVKLIEDKYGMNSSEFVKCCEDLAKSVYNISSNDNFEDLHYIDDFFLKCLEKESKEILSYEETVNFYNYYRNYKLQDQSHYVDYSSGDMKDLTEQYYDFSSIENNLYEKYKEYNILNMNTFDEKTNRDIFDATIKIYDEYYIFSSDVALIKNDKVFYDEDTNKLVITSSENAVVHDLSNGIARYLTNEDGFSKEYIDNLLLIDNNKLL